jgi:hypothetical protein
VEELLCEINGDEVQLLLSTAFHRRVSELFGETFTSPDYLIHLLIFTSYSHSLQRDQLDLHYDVSLSELFDVAETRRNLLAKRAELVAECEANQRLQLQFDRIASQLKQKPQSAPPAVTAPSQYDHSTQ